MEKKILSLNITSAAAHVIETELRSGKKLRIFVEGGGEGCGSGYLYGLAMDEEQMGDLLIQTNTIQIIIDQKSLPYVNGLKIDYDQDHFVLSHPQAQKESTCELGGCSGC